MSLQQVLAPTLRDNNFRGSKVGQDVKDRIQKKHLHVFRKLAGFWTDITDVFVKILFDGQFGEIYIYIYIFQRAPIILYPTSLFEHILRFQYERRFCGIINLYIRFQIQLYGKIFKHIDRFKFSIHGFREVM